MLQRIREDVDFSQGVRMISIVAWDRIVAAGEAECAAMPGDEDGSLSHEHVKQRMESFIGTIVAIAARCPKLRVCSLDRPNYVFNSWRVPESCDTLRLFGTHVEPKLVVVVEPIGPEEEDEDDGRHEPDEWDRGYDSGDPYDSEGNSRYEKYRDDRRNLIGLDWAYQRPIPPPVRYRKRFGQKFDPNFAERCMGDFVMRNPSLRRFAFAVESHPIMHPCPKAFLIHAVHLGIAGDIDIPSGMAASKLVSLDMLARRDRDFGDVCAVLAWPTVRDLVIRVDIESPFSAPIRKQSSRFIKSVLKGCRLDRLTILFDRRLGCIGQTLEVIAAGVPATSKVGRLVVSVPDVHGIDGALGKLGEACVGAGLPLAVERCVLPMLTALTSSPSA